MKYFLATVLPIYIYIYKIQKNNLSFYLLIPAYLLIPVASLKVNYFDRAAALWQCVKWLNISQVLSRSDQCCPSRLF